jgi:hypothetical protein
MWITGAEVIGDAVLGLAVIAVANAATPFAPPSPSVPGLRLQLWPD